MLKNCPHIFVTTPESLAIILTSKKTFVAVEKYNAKSVVVGGGVSANGRLREMMSVAGEDNNVKVFFPEKKYSTDNGAMIATAAYYKQKYFDLEKLQADPSLLFA